MKSLGPEKLFGERRIRERGGADACLEQVPRWAGVPVKTYFPEKLLGERRIRGGGSRPGYKCYRSVLFLRSFAYGIGG